MQLINGNGVYDRYLLTEEECEALFDEDTKYEDVRYPDSDKGYVATVLTKEEHMFSGVSYGSDTHTLTMHSEMTALAHAAIHGETDIIAISGPNCHICKQLIYESSLRSHIDTVVITKENGHFIQTPISELMPQPWPLPSQS